MAKSAIFLLLLCSALLLGCSEGTKPLQKYEHAIEGSFAGELSRDGKYSLVSSIHHGLSLWNNQTNEVIYQWSHQGAERNDVYIARISDASTHAVTATRNNFVVWNIKTGQAEGFYSVNESPIRDIAISSNGRFVLYGLVSGKVVHLDIDTGRRLEFLGHTEKINAVDMSANGHFALTGGNDYSAYLWDTRTGQVIYRFSHPSRVTMLKLERTGKYAFTADSKKQAQVWDLKTGKAISRLKYIHRQEIFSTARFVNDGKWLLTGSPARLLMLWDTQTGELKQKWKVSARKYSRPKSAVIYSASLLNPKQIITESSSGYVEVWPIDFK